VIGTAAHVTTQGGASLGFGSTTQNQMIILAAGTVGINKTSSHQAQFEVVSGSTSRAALHLASAASPTAPIVRLANNTTTGYEFWADYWQVQKEATADPTTSQLTAGDHFSIYRKNDKLVIAYNNGGTITYLTIPLDGSTTTWTQSTTAP